MARLRADVVAEVVLVALAAFVAATIAGVLGFGGAVVLLPVLDPVGLALVVTALSRSA
jgi:uncharacterized membrane protein YfcA